MKRERKRPEKGFSGRDSIGLFVELCLIFFVIVGDFFARRFGEQADHNDEDAGNDEGGQQFVDPPDPAHGAHEVFPDEDHGAAGDHAGQSTREGGAFPEQGEEHQGAEGRAETGPGEGYDVENGAVGVPREEGGDDSHADNGNAGDDDRGFIRHFDAEGAF